MQNFYQMKIISKQYTEYVKSTLYLYHWKRLRIKLRTERKLRKIEKRNSFEGELKTFGG